MKLSALTSLSLKIMGLHCFSGKWFQNASNYNVRLFIIYWLLLELLGYPNFQTYGVKRSSRGTQTTSVMRFFKETIVSLNSDYLIKSWVSHSFPIKMSFSCKRFSSKSVNSNYLLGVDETNEIKFRVHRWYQFHFSLPDVQFLAYTNMLFYVRMDDGEED